MDYLMHLIESVGLWTYGILFLIIFLESFPPTLFLPGDSLLFICGFLSSQGYFNLALLVGILFIASVLGYIFSYTMGKKIRNFILNSNDRYWFKRKHLEYTENFYKKYGTKTLIFGRFIPIVRSFSPTLAGTVNMNYKIFIRNIIIGGFLWTGGVTLLGFYLGKTIPNANEFLTPIIVTIIVISLIPTFYGKIKNTIKKQKVNSI